MNCPRCKGVIIQPGRYCGVCGHEFGDDMSEKIEVYFGLKQEVRDLIGAQQSISMRLMALQEGLKRLEAIISGEFDTVRTSVGREDRSEKKAESAPLPMPSGHEKQGTTAQHGRGGTAALEVRLGQKWLLIAGLLAMVFGVGYFLKYSFERGWVGPGGRVALAYLWGMMFLAGGDRFRKRGLVNFGLALSGGGIAVLYFAAFAAFQIYHLMGQTASFAVMVMITVLAGLLSVVYDAKWLAVLGMTGGFLTPVLLSTGRDNQIALMTYMTILNLGMLGIAFARTWRLLNSLGFAFTYLLYTSWAVNHYSVDKFWPAIIFLNIFYLIYTFVPLVYQFVRGRGDGIKGLSIMMLNSMITFGYSYFMIRERYSLAWVSAATIFYAFVFLSMASYLYKHGKHHLNAFVLLIAKAALFLIITVPMIFSRHWITIFWAAQALTLLWVGVRLDRKGLVQAAYGLLAVSVLKFLIYDYPVIFGLDMDHIYAFSGRYSFMAAERLATGILVIIALYASSVFSKRSSLRAISRDRRDHLYLSAMFGVLLFVVLNVETSSFFYDYARDARSASISVLWTLYSVGLVLIGFRKNSALLRKTSIGLFGATVFKVFLFDMADVSTPYLILSFIVLGLVLVGTSYLYHKFKDRLLSAISEPGTKE